MKLTEYEINNINTAPRLSIIPAEEKVWSDEARAAALAARRGNAKKPANTISTHGEFHVEKSPKGDYTVHHSGTGSMILRTSTLAGARDAASDINKNHPNVRSWTGYLNSTNARAKKPEKSFFSTGDAVELKTRPGTRLLVIDAGIDAKAGPWVAVRESKPGVGGMDQRRFVVKPGELKAWSEEAREAAAEARRRGGHGSFGRSTPIRHQLSHGATVLTVAARNATRNAKTPADHEEAASQHMNAAEAHRDAMAANPSARAHHQSRIDEHERQGARHMEEAEKLHADKEKKANSYSQDVNAGKTPRNNPPATTKKSTKK